MMLDEPIRLSGELIPLYRQLHDKAGKKYKGGSTLRKYVDEIASIVKGTDTRTILDYGCGRGRQYIDDKMHEAWGIMPTLFDPGVAGLDDLPVGQFDGVICTGVLEHIPRGELPTAFSNLAGYARKWCFIAIGIALAHRRLPDGTNAHVTVKPPDWWQQKLEPVFNGGVELHLRFIG